MAKMPKWQLVASVSVTVTGTPRREKNEKPARYPVTRIAIFRVRLGPASMMTCDCTDGGRRGITQVTYDPESLVAPSASCSHVHALYEGRRSRTFVYKIDLAPLGREMFTWRYAAEALK